MLDQAFDAFLAALYALKTYDWGVDPSVLAPIDDAVATTHGDEAARKGIETMLVVFLTSDVSRDAKDYVCRKLMVIGTASSVPALAGLLPDKDLSHMARYALERMPAAEAGQALREALGKVPSEQKVGVIGSLGVRRDTASVAALAALLGESNAAVARAAAFALGDIGDVAACKALASASSSQPLLQQALVDASLGCAEKLLAAGNKAEAQTVYKSLASENQPHQVRVAATRGLLACAAKG